MKTPLLFGFMLAVSSLGAAAENSGMPPLPPHQMRLEVPDGDRTQSPASGEQLFSNACGYCHLTFGMGTNVLMGRRMAMGLPPQTALLANRTDLTADYIAMVVRSGQGDMPRITRVDLTDSELALVAEYLTRNNP